MKARLDIAKIITRLHNVRGLEQWDEGIVLDYLKTKEDAYKDGKIGTCRLSHCRKAIRQLSDINDSGEINHKILMYLDELPESFKQVLSDVLANDEWTREAREFVKERASSFFRWCSANSYNEMHRIDEHVLREYLTDCSMRMVSISLDNIRRALKKLFIFLSEDGVLSESMSRLFLFKIPIDKKIKPFMPQDEIASVLNTINRMTQMGKRDYAIILLATVTGLRRVDIVKLTFDSIDWRNGELRIVQVKTDNPLALPLTTDVGEAIHDYILNARPKSKSDKIFLNTKAPYGEMSADNLTGLLSNYCIKAGLKKCWGFHALRRSIATNMITSGTSVETVAETLGSISIDSTKPYISLASKHLKECALDFSGISIRGEIL